MKLNGKVAIVTGSGRGIGRAIAEQLASEGAQLVINDIDEEVARETAAGLRSRGAVASVCAGSVTQPELAQRLVDTALCEHGGLDIIVNNAGYAWDGVIQKMSDEQFDAMLDVHLKAPFRLLRAASEYLRQVSREEQAAGVERFRKVVNISSIAGVLGNAGQTNYAAAKAGIIGMTRSLAREWGRYGVNVNAVAFGYVLTRMTEKGIPPAQAEMLLRSIPLGRGATVQEAAGAVALLCYPESNYISGHVLMATGGM